MGERPLLAAVPVVRVEACRHGKEWIVICCDEGMHPKETYEGTGIGLDTREVVR
jgi:hypothetical protein